MHKYNFLSLSLSDPVKTYFFHFVLFFFNPVLCVPTSLCFQNAYFPLCCFRCHAYTWNFEVVILKYCLYTPYCTIYPCSDNWNVCFPFISPRALPSRVSSMWRKIYLHVFILSSLNAHISALCSYFIPVNFIEIKF